MKKVLLILGIMILSKISLANYAIEGNWGYQQAQNGIMFDLTFSFMNNRMTLTNVCSGYGQRVAAQVSSAVTYNDSTLIVHESRQDHQSSGGLNCDISVQPDSMNYEVHGSFLILSKPGNPETFTLTRKN